MRGRAILTATAATALGVAAVWAVSARSLTQGDSDPPHDLALSPPVETAPAASPSPGRWGKWRPLLPLLGWILTVILPWAAWRTPHPVWLRWTLVGLAIGVAASLVMAALLGPGARRLAGEQAPLTGDERTALTTKDRVDAVNSARQTLIQSVTGLVVIGGVVFTALGLSYTAKTLDTSQQGQITDRYTRAVEQLGSHDQEVRLGGIYALERISRDSSRDQRTVMEVLASYIRVRAQNKPPPGSDKSRLAVDVDAALNVVGRRDRRKDVRYEFDLDNADLHSKNLEGANLTGALLYEANLTDANLSGAQLTGANLTNAFLVGASLAWSDLNSNDIYPSGSLRGAKLKGADLMGARLRGADLLMADLTGANLVGADLTGANLLRAHLSGADLDGATLTGVRGISVTQIKAIAKTDAMTRF